MHPFPPAAPRPAAPRRAARPLHARRLAAALLPLALLLALAARPAGAQEGAMTAGIPVGSKAPSAMVESLEGTAVDLATFYGKGQPVVLEFWATWCPLCRQLEPTMRAARATFGDRVRFVNVGVAANQTPERQRKHAEANGMGGTLVFDRHDAATKAFAVPHTSYVVVLDGTGMVVYTGVGGTQDIDAAVRKALGRAP